MQDGTSRRILCTTLRKGQNTAAGMNRTELHYRSPLQHRHWLCTFLLSFYPFSNETYPLISSKSEYGKNIHINIYIQQ